jgi:hypothetical protein
VFGTVMRKQSSRQQQPKPGWMVPTH